MLASVERLMEVDDLEAKDDRGAISSRRIREVYGTRLESFGIAGGKFIYIPRPGEKKEQMPVVLSGLDLIVK